MYKLDPINKTITIETSITTANFIALIERLKFAYEDIYIWTVLPNYYPTQYTYTTTPVTDSYKMSYPYIETPNTCECTKENWDKVVEKVWGLK